MKSNCILIMIFLISFTISAEDIACETSVVLPSEFRFSNIVECFSSTTADALISKPDKLKSYLDMFEDDKSTYPYYYWFYLRKGSYLSALMVLTEMVNTTGSFNTVKKYLNEFEFVVVEGMKNSKGFKSNISLNKDMLTIDSASHQFFAILNQIIMLFSKSNEVMRDDAWFIFKTYTLLYGSIKSVINWEGDYFIKRLWDRNVYLWKDKLLKDYISFFFYFTQGKQNLLPNSDIYIKKLHKYVNIIKKGNPSEIKGMQNIIELMSKFLLENISHIPEIRFIKSDELKKLQHTFFLRSEKRVKNCAYIQKRNSMFKKGKESFVEALDYNNALYILEGCDVDRLFPFIVTQNTIYIPYKERYLLDLAMALYLTRFGMGNVEKSKSIISAAILSSIAKYKKRGERSDYGEEIIYAYYTDRLQLFRDALFIYPYFHAQKDVPYEKLKEITDFISLFYLKK